MAANGPGKIVDAILASEEFRTSLTRAVEASGSGHCDQQQQQTSQYHAIKEEICSIFRPSGRVTTPTGMQAQQKPCTPSRTQTTPTITQGSATARYPIFQVCRNYTSQIPKR